MAIIFSAFQVSHIANNIDKWISIAGAPDVFSERDDHIKKYESVTVRMILLAVRIALQAFYDIKSFVC